MDIKDLMNEIGIGVYVIDHEGVTQYKPEQNKLHKHSYKFDYKKEKHVCTSCGKSPKNEEVK